MRTKASKKDLEEQCRLLGEECDDLIDLLQDILAECETHGCIHSAAITEAVDDWLEPEDGEDDVIEVTPER
jgi:hypothetical protein